MDNFLPRRGQNQHEHIKPSKSAAAHTDANLNLSPEEDSGVVVGQHLHGPKQKKTFKEWLKGITKKQWIIIGAASAVLLIGGGTGLYFLLKEDKKPVVVQEQKAEEVAPVPEPVVLTSNLTGLPIADASVNERPVTAIMIENSMDARPQAGLLGAGVIFEAVAEGSITRFVALFQDSEPDYIGPVRSVRPYYIRWALGFDAAIAHAGGSAEGLNLLKSTGAKDLNHNAAYFWRVNNRAAPHNLYTSIAKLREYEAQKGYGKANFTSLARKGEAPSAAPNARKIDFNVSTANFNVQYNYDAATNSYKRSEGGKPHTDERSGAQLSPKTVVALIMAQGKSDIYNTYANVGSGQVVIFQDGMVTEGTWKKDSNAANLSFTDAAGNPLQLNPGQTWFTALGGRERVTYTP